MAIQEVSGHSYQRDAAEEDDALGSLARRFRPALIGYFRRRMFDVAEAEDLANEVFLRMLQRGNVEAIGDARAYLFETASSVLIDHGRRDKVRRKTHHVAFDPEAHTPVDFPVERVYLGKETLNRAAVALLGLPERTRAVFVLRRLEGMKYSAIATRFGISVSAVEKQMVRAVTYLTKAMRDP
ncbi:MAG TPA: RNA polymerase sigma factor [Xanthobacteraceae bacterium]|jgi:RNA polymerase sigma-70 factor (ECF subfamily)